MNSPVWSEAERRTECGVLGFMGDPALARGFIGNHDTHASKMETIANELMKGKNLKTLEPVCL
ncbi:hypothetical protein [Algoriphagus faecimaris]|uniref:hypothetical protein n=1 Tax=Algoriphagus faecimaris TaxID=686796 RepID=UPI000B44F237|nr:hypothetical protein [Algoriphagus faecimaris]